MVRKAPNSNAWLAQLNSDLDQIETKQNFPSVKSYGAKGDGSTNDATAIQNALNAAANSGGTGVFVPPGIYMVGSPLTMPGGVMLVGAGMGASILRATATLNAAYILGNASTSLHWEMTVADLQIDGNKAAGALVTHGIYFYGGSDSIVQRVRVVNCSGNGITLDGSNTYLGTATKIVDCFVRSCGGIGVNNQANATDTMIQGSDVGQCTSHAIYVGASNCSLVGSIGWGSNVGLFIDSTATVLWCSGSRFDNNGQQGIYSKGSEVLIDGTFVHDNSHNATGTIAGIKIDTGAGKHLLAGVRSAGGLIPGQTQQSYGLELGATRTALTTVRACDLAGNATGAIGGDTSNLLVSQTLGVNPAGYLGSPAVPASGVAYTNTYPYDCTVYLHGGTISAISVNSQSITTYFGIPPLRVPRGGTVALTYTGTPQWDWFDN